MHTEAYPSQDAIKAAWAHRAELVEQAVAALKRLGEFGLAETCAETHAKPVRYGNRYYRINAYNGQFEDVVCHECGETDLDMNEAERRQCRACQRDRYREYEEDFISYADDYEEAEA